MALALPSILAVNLARAPEVGPSPVIHSLFPFTISLHQGPMEKLAPCRPRSPSLFTRVCMDYGNSTGADVTCPHPPDWCRRPFPQRGVPDAQRSLPAKIRHIKTPLGVTFSQVSKPDKRPAHATSVANGKFGTKHR